MDHWIHNLLFSIQILGALIVLIATYIQNVSLNNVAQELARMERQETDKVWLESRIQDYDRDLKAAQASFEDLKDPKHKIRYIIALMNFCKNQIAYKRLAIQMAPMGSYVDSDTNVDAKWKQSELDKCSQLDAQADKYYFTLDVDNFSTLAITLFGYNAMGLPHMFFKAKEHLENTRLQKDKIHRRYSLYLIFGTLLMLVGASVGFK